MPNQLTSSGLQIQTITEIISEITNGTATVPGLLSIYGSDINLNPNSPDGQMVNIYAQGKLDALELLNQVFDSFDPDQAVGTALDSRCAINGLARNAGTYTQQYVSVTATQALTLQGLDLSTSPFTVSDSSGNQYQLVSTYAFTGAGTQSLLFQAANIGAVTPVQNTITTIVTVTLGISAVNNPLAVTSLGLNEETDSAFRIRRQKSVGQPSIGYFASLQAALANISGVTSYYVHENNTGSTDSTGTPANSIWTVVAGGANADIANAIYNKRAAGCGMYGGVSVVITQVDGSSFTVSFDRPTAENLYVSMTAKYVSSGSSITTADANYLRTQLLAQLVYTIGQPADTSYITQLAKIINPAISISFGASDGVSSDGSTWTNGLLSPTAVNYQFATASTRLRINGTYGT
jgi:uncharacterized phage protein gp47/JayE